MVWEVFHHLVGRELPSPVGTLQDAWALLKQSDFRRHLGITTSAFWRALVIAASGGVVLGVLLGMRRLAAEVADPILAALFAVPKVILYPVFLSVFGLTIASTVAFGVIHGIIPVIVITMTAIQSIPRILIRSARSMRLSPWHAAIHVLIPATIPEIVSAMRMGFSLTLMGTLIGEMYASKAGIGFLLVRAMERDDPKTLIALALLLFVFATLVNYTLLAFERSRGHKTVLAKSSG